MQRLEQEMNEYEKLRTQQIDEQNTRMTKKLFDGRINYYVFKKAQGFDAVMDRAAQNRIELISNRLRRQLRILQNGLRNLNEGYDQVVPLVEKEAQ